MVECLNDERSSCSEKCPLRDVLDALQQGFPNFNKSAAQRILGRACLRRQGEKQTKKI